MFGAKHLGLNPQLHILSKFLDLSVPQFPDLYTVGDHSTCLTRILGRLNEPTARGRSWHTQYVSTTAILTTPLL